MLRRLLALTLLARGLLGVPAGAEPVDMVFVGAHPDDDSTATLAMARAVKEGRRVAVITATRGEQGGNLVGAESGAALGLLREEEQRRALGILGIDQLYYLGCWDSGFTTSSRVSQRNWAHPQVRQQLVRLLRFLRPTVVITMNPGPRGHGDHQYIAQMTTEAFFLAGEAAAREGLRPWKASRLFYCLDYGSEGLPASLKLTAPPELMATEMRALREYRSQGWHQERLPVQSSESFWLAVNRADSGPLDGLFPGEGATWKSHPRPLQAPPVELERAPALRRFLQWSRHWGLPLEALAPPTRVCEPGQGVDWPLVYRSGLRGPSQLSLRAPKSIGPHPGRFQDRSLPGQMQDLAYLLQVVPGLHIRPGIFSDWQAVETCWEGTRRSPQEASARFRLRRLAGFLEVEIQGFDDHGLADLAPSENRAHWRTDAVEITLDPSGLSQDTTTTFKLGVILRNSAGRPMAARDADARPGPWAGAVRVEPAPGGYRMKVRIPESDLPSKLGQDFGFNVLIYDSDPGQAPARLAWSAWETIQARPELWGRVHLR